MAFNINFNSDVMLTAINRELDERYGKGDIYRNMDYEYHRETFTHVTKDRVKRTFDIDKYALDRGDIDPIRLLSEDHSHRLQSLSFPPNQIKPEMSPTSMVYYEHMRGQYIKEKYEEIPVKPKKKSNIRERLQKETDSWLKSVQKEED